MYQNYKRTVIYLIVLVSISNLISAQNWADIKFSPDKDPNSTPPRVLFSENASSKLYIGGNFLNVTSSITHGVVTYDPTNGWLQFGNIIGDVLDIINFNNEIYVGTNDGVFKWDGAKWDTIGLVNTGGVGSLFIFNNELYAGGAYNTMDTTISKGLAKWDGISWKRVGNYKQRGMGTIYDINEFNGELYVFGQLVDSLGIPMNISKFNGTTWSRVTNLFNGCCDEIVTSAVYNNELYVGGLFGKYQGSAFNFIAKFNGTTWSDVGSNGVTHSSNSNGQVEALNVIDNKLYAVGVFNYADNVEAQYIASWDGLKWCGYGNGFDNRITEIVKANDTIFISGGFWKYNTDSILRVAKWIGGNFVDTCSSSVGIEELYNNDHFSIYPNPTTSILNIIDEQNELQNSVIEIKNNLGQSVFNSPFTSQLDLSGLSAGMYFLTIQGKSKKKTVKIIKE